MILQPTRSAMFITTKITIPRIRMDINIDLNFAGEYVSGKKVRNHTFL